MNVQDEDDHIEHNNQSATVPLRPSHTDVPTSPPPSFRSRNSSFGHAQQASDRTPLVSNVDTTLEDTFESPSDDEAEDDDTHESDHRLDDRQRVMSGRPSVADGNMDSETTGMLSRRGSGERPAVERTVTQLPVGPPAATTRAGRTYGGGNMDGVFANINAKPVPGEEVDEKPPVRLCTCVYVSLNND